MPTITRKEILAIASEQMAGMQAPGYSMDATGIRRAARIAVRCAYALIEEIGFTAEEAPKREPYSARKPD